MQAVFRLALIALISIIPPGVRTATGAPANDLEPRALELLTATTSRLERAKTFSFRTRNTPGVADGTPFSSFFADAQFSVMRPDKARVRVRGEAPPLDVFFDGRTLTVYQPSLNLYATSDDPRTRATLIPFALQQAGVLFPLADVFAGEPGTMLTQRLTRARYKGSATIAGKPCERGAFAAPGVEWDLWIDARTALPCRLTGRLLDMQAAPRFAVDFHDWKLNPPLPASSFTFARPAGAGQLDIRALLGV